ncbi:ABC transporter ATP-binding protein [Oryctes borbonicus]|uniref:ABC transporter ATP-binding protein n=1 Tax=Oryctes borbonicus TaxID=1629725 RepID=A0A0T6B885_9SCAR|nr:ABC transporter ATP-binding protein [Oryctes borbonicus]
MFTRILYTVTKPMAIGKLVSYFSPASTVTIHDAYRYSVLITLILFLQPLFNHTYYMRMIETAQQIRIGLCSLVYRKSLKLSTSSLIEITNGKIVTIISKDVMLFETMLQFINEVWIGIVQVIAMTYVMYTQIGVPALIGIGFLVLLTPLQGVVAKLTMKTKLKVLARFDERIRLIQEVLSTIQIIKIYTWENYFRKLVDAIRKSEVSKLRIMYYLKVITIALGHMSSKISFYICIVTYTLFHESITAEKAFVVLSCYGGIQHALNIAIPLGIYQFAETKSSVKRIKKFLLSPEVSSEGTSNIYEHTSPTLYTGDKEKRIELYNIQPACVKTTDLSVEVLKGQPILHNINLHLCPGLYAVCGPIGSGKSTLLKALLNDLPVVNGKLNINGSCSYASQDPWLFPGTIRQNILFGLPFEHERYNHIVDICGLRRDFEILPDGDSTLVNDRGLNLSKGQQARVNLARAIYKNADIYLLDSPLSALDATVCKQVFETCFKKFLQKKICIVVMHQVQFLKEVDKILILKDGRLESEGTFGELNTKSIHFGMDTIQDHVQGNEVTEKDGNGSSDVEADETTKLLDDFGIHKEAKKLYAENKKEGKVEWSVYKSYFKLAGGWKTLPFLFILSCLQQTFQTGFDYFISYWINVEENLYVQRWNGTTNSTIYEETLAEKKIIPLFYTILIVSATVFTIANSVYIFILFSLANKRLHNICFWQIIQAPMAFFDLNLSGNILNRFSKDVNVVDEHIPILFFQCIRLSLIVIGIVVSLSIVKIGFLAVSIGFASVLFLCQRIYLPTSRSLKRLDGVTRSPVIGHLNASLEGLTTIRASGVQNILAEQFDKHQDLHSSASYMYLSTNRAFGFYIDMFCVAYSMIIMFSLLLFSPTNAGKVGLALNLAFGLGTLLQFWIRQWTELENQMTSVERILEYRDIQTEDASGSTPENWPNRGCVQYSDVHMKYPKTNQEVLKGMNFIIEPGQKIGIIGRTGAGKTSVISALFRLYDLSEGHIRIGDVDIKSLEIRNVRSKISIIPQNPIIFSGTIRSNLDPNREYDDSSIWRVLDDVGLKTLIMGLDSGLEHKTQDGGSNFSTGQKQLICLARAALRNNKIVVLDEATANIDLQTDILVQETIKKKFGHCTILMIAHKLNTVLDSDKVMVVNNGQIVEFDKPEVLLNDKESNFYYLVSQSGLLKKSS